MHGSHRPKRRMRWPPPRRRHRPPALSISSTTGSRCPCRSSRARKGRSASTSRNCASKTGMITLRPRLREHRRLPERHHVHRRRAGHPPLRRISDRGARREELVPRGRVAAHQRGAADPDRSSRRFRREVTVHTMVHQDFGRFFEGLPEGRPSDAGVLRGGRRARDLLPAAGDRAEHPRHRDPAHREDADDCGVLLQALARPAVHLSPERARLLFELPAHDVRHAVRGVRGRSGPGEGGRSPADPPRRPRAELLDQHGAGRRQLAREPVCEHRGRHQRALGPAPRRRQPAGDRDAGSHRGRRRRRARVRRSREGQEGQQPPHGLRPPRLQELRPAGDHPQEGLRRRPAREGPHEPSARDRHDSSRRSR